MGIEEVEPGIRIVIAVLLKGSWRRRVDIHGSSIADVNPRTTALRVRLWAWLGAVSTIEIVSGHGEEWVVDVALRAG